MLKHYTGRLARRLALLLVLLTTFAAVSPSTPAAYESCLYQFDEWGNCVRTCCYPKVGCVESSCN